MEEWHFASINQLSGLSVSGTLVENELSSIKLNQISLGTGIIALTGKGSFANLIYNFLNFSHGKNIWEKGGFFLWNSALQ